MEGDPLAMKPASFLIRKIIQKDNHTFTITWSDGVEGTYRLSDLQKNCPCAKCVDETTGKRLINEKAIDPDVRAYRITSVGRYALRIQFTSGCSTGIYRFDILHQMAKEVE